MIPLILKLLTPSKVKAILSYVFEKNDLDYKVDKIYEMQAKNRERIDALESRGSGCKYCQERIEEASKLTQSTGDETI